MIDSGRAGTATRASNASGWRHYCAPERDTLPP